MSNYRKPEIIVLCGPMWSGKSNALLMVLDKLKYSKIPYVVFKPSIDPRSKNKIVTRYLGHSEEAIEVDNKNPKEILSKLDLSNVKLPFYVALDEAQFYTPEIVDVVKELHLKGIGLVIAGLDLDAAGRTFGSMGDLLALATSVKKLTAVCMKCCDTACRSALREADPDFEKDNIRTGNDDVFIALCIDCFYKFKK